MPPDGPSFVKPEIVVSHFHIRHGDVVADYGAGVGFFVPALMSRIGSEGKLYACEIQKSLIEKLSTQAHLVGHHNVFPLWCDIEEENGIHIESGAIDIGVLINTLYMVEDKNTAVIEIGRTLRTGGKFFVIDWSETYLGVGPKPEAVVAADTVKALLESNGFIFEREFDAGAHHYGLAFRKL
jgi:ubiquinone/menaquinone biosynthesis C-methylase UbiE